MERKLFSIFRNHPHLRIALSQKKDGPMKLSGVLKRDQKIIQNRERFFKRLEIEKYPRTEAHLIHRSRVEVADSYPQNISVLGADGLLSSRKNLFLSLTVADCLPLFLFNPQKEIIGLIHGGWRSLAQNILGRAIKKSTEEFNSDPQNFLGGIGPGISKCHFEVGKEVWDKFEPFFPQAAAEDNPMFLDLKKVAQIQLIRAGVKKENIEISPECTYCRSDKYFSFRRDKNSGSPSQFIDTMIVIMGMVDDPGV